MINVVRIFNDDKGDSYFQDITVPLTHQGNIGYLSEPIRATHVIFREVDPSYDWDFHTAPRRQYIILLDGEIEIETSLGAKRQFKAGDILLVEDTEGKGHKTRNLQPITRRSIFIELP